MAGSIASIIAFASTDPPTIPSNAFLMIHKPWTDLSGNANDFRKMANDLDAIETGILNIYQDNLADGVEIETIQQLMEAETWLNGEQAAQYFNINIGEQNTIAAAVQDYTKMHCHNTPDVVLKTEGTNEKESNEIKEKENICKSILKNLMFEALAKN